MGFHFLLRLRRWSASAFGVALLSTTVAILIQEALRTIIGIELHFAVFFPTIVLVSLMAGAPAGAFAAALAVPIIWWEFLPPQFEFALLTPADYDRFVFFLLPLSLAICACQLYREALAVRGKR